MSNNTGELNDDKGPYKFINMNSGINKSGEITNAITLRMFWYVDDKSTYGVRTDTSKYHFSGAGIARFSVSYIRCKLEIGGSSYFNRYF